MTDTKPLRAPSAIACCACGSHLTNNEDWETHNGKDKFLYLDAEQLESKYLDKDMPGLWASLYRLIIYDFNKGKFTLTGIGQQFQNVIFTVPKSPAKASTGRPPEERKDSFKEYIVAPALYWWNGYLPRWERGDWCHLAIGIHMSCWKLAQWKLGPGVAENLELFIAIALRTAFKSLLGFRGNMPHPRPFSIYEMVVMTNSTYGMYVKLDGQQMLNDNPDEVEDRLVEIWVRNEYDLRDRVDYDPFTNSWVQDIIDSSRQMEKQTPFAKPLIPDLPLEILFDILDFLGCKEISNFAIALQITIPDCYWRSRAALNLVEIDGIAEEDLNWQYLCSKYEAAYATSEKLESRRFILDILSNTIKPIYLRNLGERDIPHLGEVMDECSDELERLEKVSHPWDDDFEFEEEEEDED